MPTMEELRQEVTNHGCEWATGDTADDLMAAIGRKHMDEETLPQRGFMLIGSEGVTRERWLHSHGRYILEPKIDEIRMQMHFYRGRVRFQGRRRQKETYLYGEKSDNYPQYHDRYCDSLEGTILDGGMVFGPRLTNKKQLWKDNDLFMMISINGSLPERAVTLQEKKGWARYIVFDIIKFKDKWLNDWSFERRRVLAEVLVEELQLDIVNQWHRGFEGAWDFITGSGGEGVVLKKRNGPYVFGKSEDWVRMKVSEDVVGYIHSMGSVGEGRNAGKVGSVNIADSSGNIIGMVGNLSDEERDAMTVDPYTDEPSVPFPQVQLARRYRNRQVLIRHNGVTGRGGFRHARIVKWSEEGQDLNLER